MRPPAGEALTERVRAFVAGEGGDFEALALDLHRYQVANDPVAAALLTGPVRGWRDIPAVPVDLFKELAVGTVPPGQGVAFRTSGTTQGRRGEHRLWATDLYDLNAVAWARRCVPELPAAARALLLDPAAHPDASLSHMVARLCPDARWYLGDDGVDTARLAAELGTAPVFLAATSFALEAWLADPAPLPAGSVVMVTGGFKGRAHALDGEQLYAAARAALPGARIVTEYGMTELSSQLWGEPGGPFRAPPWLRPYAVDPVSGAPLPDGVPGQLRFVDLCNVDAAVAVETQDEGVVSGDTVLLRGRLPGAAARGCSLTAEERRSR